MKIKVTLFSILLLHSLFLSAQIRIDWQQCYGSMKDDEIGNIIKKDNGYYVLGYVEEGESGMVECEFSGIRHTWLLEIDENGGLLKQQCFDFAANKIFESTREAHSLFLLGLDGVGIANKDNPTIMKITKEGAPLWHRSFGAEDHNFLDGPKFTPTTDGGFISSVSICFSGGDISHYYGFWDDWVVKLDSLGNIDWETTIGTEEGEYASSIIANPDGTYFALITGSPGENGSIPNCKKPYYNSDAVVVRLSADGNILDSQCYGGNENEGFGSVINLDNGCLFVGNTNSVDEDLEGSGWHSGYNHLGTPTSDAWLLRTDYDGNVLWSRCYGGSGDDYGSWVFQNDDGGFTVFGTTQSYDGDVQSGMDYFVAYNAGFGRKIWVFRTDAEGNLLWERVIGHKGQDISLGDVIKESDVEYTIAATSVVGNDPEIMMDFNCTNSNLCFRDSYWVLHITDIFDYDDPTGMEESMAETQPRLQMSVHPNPATTWATIDYTLPNGNAKAELSIFNAMGLRVKLVELEGNEGQKVLDLRELAGGVYTCTIACGGFLQTQKLVVTK